MIIIPTIYNEKTQIYKVKTVSELVILVHTLIPIFERTSCLEKKSIIDLVIQEKEINNIDEYILIIQYQNIN